MQNIEEIKGKRLILGLDVSTTCIGCCLMLDEEGDEERKIVELTHVTPKIDRKIKGIEALFLKKKIFENEFLEKFRNVKISHVIIEEPLLSSNNVNTVSTLLRFNGMISEAVYNILGVVPDYISSYDARKYSFPDLIAIRKFNKKGEVYNEKDIKKSLRNNHACLFGEYPWDIDKKQVMMDKVNELYKDIPWLIGKNGDLKKENYDSCDALVCVLAYLNKEKYGEMGDPLITNVKWNGNEVSYTINIWNLNYQKSLKVK